MNVTVFCGSNCGNDPIFAERTEQLGKWIGENGHTLIYGGGSVGLMGILADAVMKTGGEAIGITPNFFIEQDKTHKSLSELEVVPSMAVRKDRMIELGDLFIAMPGGVGTLDEMYCVMALHKLNFHNKPMVFYNVSGFYDSTKTVLEDMVNKGFYDQKQLDEIIFASTPEKMATYLNERR